MKINKRNFHIFVIINLCIKKNAQGNQLRHVNTHDHIGKVNIKLSNEAFLSRRLIGYPPGNKTSPYINAMLSAFNCSTDQLINYSLLSFI